MRVSNAFGNQPMGSVGSLLLAAGWGTRLRPLTDVVAKPALPVLDVPLGAWGLDALERACPPVVVNASNLAESLSEALGLVPPTGEVPPRGTTRLLLELPDPFGTGGTLRALRNEVSDRLVTWNSDSLTNLDLGQLLTAHQTSGAGATIAIVPTPDHADFEMSGGRVTKMIDRHNERCSGVRFIGIAVYEREALDLLSDRVPLGAAEGLLRPLLEAGELHTFEHNGYWLDVGTPSRYLAASQDALDGRAPSPPHGWPGDIVSVPGGHAYSGPGVDVEIDSVGPGAVLLAGSVVEPGARVSHSVVWPGERVPSGTSLESCIWFAGRPIDAAPET